MPDTALPANDLDQISCLKAIPDQRMRCRIRTSGLVSAAPGGAWDPEPHQTMRNLERLAIRHHSGLTEALGLELRRPPSDSAQWLRHAGLRPGSRYFFRQVDGAALCAAIRDWTIAQMPGDAADLDQLVCDGKTLRCVRRQPG